jgi:predicted nucleic acid-binding protein
MPGTTWNWIRCSKFSSRVRSLRSRGRNRPRFFIGRVKGTLLRTSTCQRIHTRLPIWQSKTNSSRKIENAAVIERKKKRVTTSSNEFWLPSEQSTLIRVTTTKQRGAGSACDGSGGYSGLAFGSAAPASDLASQQQQFAPALYEMVRERCVQRLGATRQELLSGIREASQFRRIRTDLRPFADVFLRAPDDEEAAQMRNKGRSAGVASTAVLICAVALQPGWQIFTTNRDFSHYARAIPIQLFSVA